MGENVLFYMAAIIYRCSLREHHFGGTVASTGDCSRAEHVPGSSRPFVLFWFTRPNTTQSPQSRRNTCDTSNNKSEV